MEGKSSSHCLGNEAEVEGLYYFDALLDFKSVNFALKVTQGNYFGEKGGNRSRKG